MPMSRATFRPARSCHETGTVIDGREPQHQCQRGEPAEIAAARQAEIRRDAAGLGDPGAGARTGAGRNRGRSAAALRWRAQRRRHGRSARRQIRRTARGDPDRRRRDAAGSRRQGISDRSARRRHERHPRRRQHSRHRAQRRARGSGIATLDGGDVRHSAGRARRADAPLPAAMPLLLQPGRTRPRRHRTDDRGMEEGLERARRNRRAADPFLRRRADRAQGPGRTGAACHRCRAVQQPHHLSGAADQGKAFRAGRCRALPCADQFSGQRAHRRRPRRRV